MSGREELERLLRNPVERLGPPDGAWEQISKRARRRRMLSASASVAAIVVIVAGAVPAVIAVRHSANNQSVVSTNQPTPGPTTTDGPKPAVASQLSGYFPESLSFVSQDVGYLWGSTDTSPAGVVARTTDGGHTWTKMNAPPVKNEFVARHGAAQIRFASGEVGFLYGSENYLTTDGGQTWAPYAAPGYIADLESFGQRFFALVRKHADSPTVQLYTGTAAHPTLVPVTDVPAIKGTGGTPEIAGAASVAVSGSHVDVIVGDSAFYSSPDGKRWVARTNPCGGASNLGKLRSTIVSSTTTLGVAVACGYDTNAATTQTKRVFISRNSGKNWKPVQTEPASSGLLETLTGNGDSDLIIGTSLGGSQATHNGGKSWANADPPGGVMLSFVGYIDQDHIVAVADRVSVGVGSFASSMDSGSNWTVHRFS